MKRIFFISLAFLFSSCAPRLQTVISSPTGPSVVFVQPSSPMVLGGLSEEEIKEASLSQCAVANRGSIRFAVDGCYRVWVWLEDKGNREPDFSLAPGQVQSVVAPVGILKIYAEAERKDLYGWHDLGAVVKEIRVSPFVWQGGEGWRIDLHPGEFPGMRIY